VDGVQYIAVQSGWGVDAQRMQNSLDDIRGTKTDVPQGGVIWVFALEEVASDAGRRGEAPHALTDGARVDEVGP